MCHEKFNNPRHRKADNPLKQVSAMASLGFVVVTAIHLALDI
jgi:hypothetical protein